MMDNTLILIDGSSFIFRAYHAMPNLTSPDGKPTGATYGIVNMLKQIQKKYSTPHWGCVFDTVGKTFREEFYPEYKANRAETPKDLLEQFNDIYGIIKALGIPVVMQTGVEADDIIGSLATKAKLAGKKVLIVTGDKDFAQLVDEDITLINTMTNEVLDYNGVINKFGVKPKQIIDYLTLIGDKVDNVPGVDKCGPKTAAKWLNQYENLDNIIAHQHELSGVVGENLRQSLNWLTTAKFLITIKSDLDLSTILPNQLSDLTLTKADSILLTEYYTKLGFKSWLKDIPSSNNDLFTQNTVMPIIDSSTILNNPVIIESKQELQKVVEKIINQKNSIALFLIPDSYQQPTMLRLVALNTENTTYLIHNKNLATNDLFDFNTVDSDYHKVFATLFGSTIAKIIPNYKETLQILTKLNLPLNNVIGDLTLLHYIWNSKQTHTLNNIYKEYLSLTLPELNKLYLTNTDELLEVSNKIVSYAFTLEKQIQQELNDKELKLYKQIELPLAKILVKIENAGIALDVAQFKILEQELSSQIAILENKIYAEAKCVFNINSTKQLQDILFNQLQLSTIGIKKNVHGYSTDEDSLNILAEQNIAIAKLMLEYRGLSKLLNTYVAKLPLLVDKASKVHTTYDQALVASGRLSSRDPNLQNIPIKSNWGKRIRQCFIAEPGYALICADYSQIELRILAHLSGDENLIKAFNENLDIHSITASEIFNKPINEISKDERRYAKTINFSLLYGKTAFGLAQELKIDRLTAKAYIDTYFAKYPKIKDCLEQIKQEARNNEFVSTVFGRKIYLPNINSSNKIVREAEERLALNAPMQGTSADIIKIAMINIDQWLREQKLASQLILQVHDELILQVPEKEIAIVKDNLTKLMTNGINLSVNLGVDIKIAQNWDDAH